MSLANGRHYLAIPGPSVVPDRVLQAMHMPAPNIYEGELITTTASLIPDLNTVAGSTGHVAMYIANGHGVWEAAIANTLQAGDTVLVVATGRFCIGWGDMAAKLGVKIETLDYGKQSTFDPGEIEATLRRDTGHKIKAVMAVHSDTSTSVRNDIAALRGAMDAANHPALLLVDCMASLGCDAFAMDDWGVDVMVAGCQKGLMTPAGMGFVFFNDKALAVRKGMKQVSSYWDWLPRVFHDQYYQQWCGTAPTHHIFGLRAALDMLMEEGIAAVFARHARLSQGIWAACEAWGQGGPMTLNISDPALRSHSVTAVHIGAPHGTALRKWVTRNAGVTLGIGLGMAEPKERAWHGFFRIGHMGHVNAQMVMGTLGAIEAGMCALDIPHGTGALSAAAKVFAGETCDETSKAG